jgi:predicted RNase H-like HicB family nuclease
MTPTGQGKAMKTSAEKTRRVLNRWRSRVRRATGDTVAESTYTVRLEPAELDGGYIAEVLELPGCMSQGESVPETLENIVAALRAVLEAEGQGRVQIDGVHLPKHSRSRDPQDFPVHVHAYA